jgi:sphingomyelin phosphodiesterase acid-like 3
MTSSLQCLTRAVTLTLVVQLIAAVRLAFISDLHLDLFYGTSRAFARHNSNCSLDTAPRMGMYGCDSSLELVNSSLWHLAQVGRPDHVIIAGDWLRHDMYTETNSSFQTFAAVATIFQEALGGNSGVLPVPSYGTTMGNNDLVPDYVFDVASGTAPPLMGQMAAALRSAGSIDAEEEAMYARGGFYTRRLNGTNLDLIVMNTILWTYDLLPSVATVTDPLGQFKFIDGALSNATRSGRKALLLSHMPPTVNLYESIRDPSANAASPSVRYFLPQYEAVYCDLLKKYSATLVAHVFGHTHRFSFSASGADFGNVPMIVVGAISPVYDNNPNYLTAEFDDAAGIIRSLRQYYLPIDMGRNATWRGTDVIPAVYDARSIADFTPSTIAIIADSIATNDTAFAVWRRMYGGNATRGDACDAACRKLVACYTREARPSKMYACRDASDAPSTQAPLLPPPDKGMSSGAIAAIIFLVIFIVVGSAVGAIVLQRRHDVARKGMVELDDAHPSATEAAPRPASGPASAPVAAASSPGAAYEV